MLVGLGSYIFRYSAGSSALLPGSGLDHIGMIHRASELGVMVVQFADNLPLDPLSGEELGKIRAAALEHGIILETGMHGATVERMYRYLEISESLDSRLLRVALHSPDIKPTYEESVEIIQTVLPAFRSAGVSIAIENHYTMSSQQLLSFIQAVNDPLVGVCLDTANSIIQGEWPTETARILGPHALSLHLKDYKLETHPNMLGVVITGEKLGAGKLRINEIFALLQEFGRDVNIILEQWMPPEVSAEKTLRKEAEWIRDAVEAAGKLVIEFEGRGRSPL